MKKLVTIMLAVLMMIVNVTVAEEVASPTLPVMKPVEIRNNEGKVIEADAGLIVDIKVKEETKEVTVAALDTVEKKTAEIADILSGIVKPIVVVPEDSEDTSEETGDAEGTETPVAPVTVEEVKKQIEEAYVQVFGEEAVEALKVVITETIINIDPEAELSVGDMVIDEIVPLYVGGYEEEMGEIKVVVETVAEYKETDVLIAMIGIIPEDAQVPEEDSEEEIMLTWIPLTATVEEGNVVIAFTEEAMLQTNGKESVVVLMRAAEYEEFAAEQNIEE